MQGTNVLNRMAKTKRSDVMQSLVIAPHLKGKPNFMLSLFEPAFVSP